LKAIAQTVTTQFGQSTLGKHSLVHSSDIDKPMQQLLLKMDNHDSQCIFGDQMDKLDPVTKEACVNCSQIAVSSTCEETLDREWTGNGPGNLREWAGNVFLIVFPYFS